jgi:hypothetical protein
MDPYTITKGRTPSEQETLDNLRRKTCGFCGDKHPADSMIPYDEHYLICRDCALKDDGHEYGVLINKRRIYYFETFMAAHDFALAWRGLVIDDQGNVMHDFEA